MLAESFFMRDYLKGDTVIRQVCVRMCAYVYDICTHKLRWQSWFLCVTRQVRVSVYVYIYDIYTYMLQFYHS